MTRSGLFFAGAFLMAGCDSHPNVNFREDGTPAPTPTVVPGAPLEVVAVAGTGSISLTWSAPVTGDPAISYRVLVATTSFDLWDSGLPGAVATTASCCAFTNAGLSDEQTYWLGVTALNEAGEGPISQVVSARPPGWSGFQVIDAGGGESVRVLGVAVSATSVFVGGLAGGSLDGISSAGLSDAFVSRFDRTGRRVWTRMLGGLSIDSAWSVATDSSGNLVMAGTYNSTPNDYLLARYFEVGTLDFDFVLGSANGDEARGVAIDAAWNIYVTGYTLGVDLDGEVNNGSSAAFLVKFDSTGSRVSTKLVQAPGIVGDEGNAVSVAPDGTAWVAGMTTGILPSGSLPANSGIGTDGFVSKFSSAGSMLWTKQITSSGTDEAQAVAVDDAGNVYVAGVAGGNLGDGLLNGPADAFIGKFSSSGTQTWLHLLGNAGYDAAYGIAVSQDTLYVVGETGSGLGSGTSEAFLAAYDLAGTLLWTTSIGTDQSDEGGSVAVGPDGFIYVGGAFGTDQVTDGFLGKFSTYGALQ